MKRKMIYKAILKKIGDKQMNKLNINKEALKDESIKSKEFKASIQKIPCYFKKTNKKKIIIDNEEMMVDKQIVNLIKELDKAGLKVIHSCAGHSDNALFPNEAYLSFDKSNIVGVSISEFVVQIRWRRDLDFENNQIIAYDYKDGCFKLYDSKTTNKEYIKGSKFISRHETSKERLVTFEALEKFKKILETKNYKNLQTSTKQTNKG